MAQGNTEEGNELIEKASSEGFDLKSPEALETIAMLNRTSALFVDKSTGTGLTPSRQ